MDATSRASSPGPSESVFSQDFTQLEGDSERGFDLRLRLERAGSTMSSPGPTDLSQLNLVSLSRPFNDGAPDSNRDGFHAISTVLNHPTKRPAPLRPSRIPLPPAPPSEPLPKVNRKDIDAYIKDIAPEWERFERARRAGEEGENDEAGANEAGEKERLFLPKKIDPKDLQPLRTVPEVFFQPGFDLGNPWTFDLVTERVPHPPSSRTHRPSESRDNSSAFNSPLPELDPLPSLSAPSTPTSSSKPRSTKPPLSSSALNPDSTSSPATLQEKLSNHLDTVEQHLVLEISRRSSSFFAALTNLQDLQSESSSCLSRIDSLHAQLRALDEGQAQRGLQAVKLSSNLKKIKRVEGAVKEIRGVEEALEMIKGLVASGDGFGAVEIWEEVDSWLKRKGKGKEREVVPTPEPSPNPKRRTPSASPRPSPRSSPHSRPLKDLPELPESDIPTVLASSSTSATPTKHLGVPKPKLTRNHSSSNSISRSHSPKPLKSTSTTSSTPTADLTVAASLSHLPASLASLALAIATQLESELQAVLTSELARPQGGGEEGLKARLTPLVLGLVRVREGGRLIEVYREVAIAEVRDAVKKHMPLNAGETADEDLPRGKMPNGAAPSASTATLMKNLRDMSHPDFLAIEKSMFAGLLGCIKTVELFSRSIEAILTSAGSTTANRFILPPSVPPTISTDLLDVLSTAAELSHSRASKIIGVRNEQHAALSLVEFLEMFGEAWTFVVACEVVCRKMIVGLRGTMVVQAKTFLSSYHSQRVSASARLVENELWAAVDTSPEQQHAVDLLIQSAISDPFELLLIPTSPTSPTNPSTPSLSAPSSTNDPDKSSSLTTINGGTDSPSGNGKDKDKDKKHLVIEEKTYFVVAATLGSVELLVDYVKIVLNIEMLTTDVMSRLIEYLKSFNSRTCQVVLGAGAMRSAGLKNITAKHLALASQSLSVMIALIPYIRETLRRHLNPKQAVMLVEFDRLKRDYQEHQNEIHSKLVAIMGDRLALHLKSLREIDWEVPSKRPGKPNEYAELLVKESTQLWKILSKYLPEQVVDLVISQVFASINHSLSQHYTPLELKSEEAKNRLLLDATYLTSKLAVLPNVTPMSSALVTLVEDKSVPRRPVAASMRNLMRRVSSQGSVEQLSAETGEDEGEGEGEGADKEGAAEGKEEDMVADEGSKGQEERDEKLDEPKADGQAGSEAKITKEDGKEGGELLFPPSLDRPTTDLPSILGTPLETSGRTSPRLISPRPTYPNRRPSSPLRSSSQPLYLPNPNSNPDWPGSPLARHPSPLSRRASASPHIPNRGASPGPALSPLDIPLPASATNSPLLGRDEPLLPSPGSPSILSSLLMKGAGGLVRRLSQDGGERPTSGLGIDGIGPGQPES